MLQCCLEALLAVTTISIEQESVYYINIDDVIETFKILKPVKRHMEL